MPPKRKTKRKPPKRSKSQSQSQRQSVTINLNKTTPAKKKRSGRGGLPPPSHLQNLAPTFVTAPQVDYVGLIGEISRLTAKVQDPVPIRNPVTPLQATLQASNAEAQQMAGQKAEERRAGPTAENFQPPPSRARSMSQDLEGFETASSSLVVSPDSSVVRQQQATEALNFIRPPDPAFRERLVNPADPPKRGIAGQGEGSGGLPFAESVPKVGRPRKDTQKAIPVNPPIAQPRGEIIRQRAREPPPPSKPRQRSPAPPRKPQRRKSRDSI